MTEKEFPSIELVERTALEHSMYHALDFVASEVADAIGKVAIDGVRETSADNLRALRDRLSDMIFVVERYEDIVEGYMAKMEQSRGASK